MMTVYTWYTVRKRNKVVLVGEGNGFVILSNHAKNGMLYGWRGNSFKPMVARYDGEYDAYIIDNLIGEFIDELTREANEKRKRRKSIEAWRKLRSAGC